MKYTIEVSSKARRQLNKLPVEIERRATLKIDALADNPRPPGILKMQGHENQWRIRVGDYRVVYEIKDNIITVLIVAVAHRSQIYDRPR